MTVENNGRSEDGHENSTSTRTGEIRIGKTEEDHESTKMLSNSVPEIRLFKRRWLQLVLFTVFSTTINMQWYQYTSCSHIMQKYWDVSLSSVQWTSMIYRVAYLIGIFPATYLMRRISLRWTVLIGAGGTCIGAWIKVFSVPPDLFAVTFIGQTVVAISHIFVTTLPGRLAACWFGPKEVSTATTIARYGIPTRFSLGFVVTTHSVRNHDNIADIGDDLQRFFIIMAIICTFVLVLILLQANHETGNTEGFWPPVKRILTNRSFIVLSNSYGSIIGIFSIGAQFYGTVMILITGKMIEMYGDVAGHACMIVTLAFGTILAISTKLDLRRSEAARVAGYSDVRLQELKPQETESIKP